MNFDMEWCLKALKGSGRDEIAELLGAIKRQNHPADAVPPARKLYLCGPINGCTDAECMDWRAVAKGRLVGKFDILDPMRRDYRGREAGNAGPIVSMDYRDIWESWGMLVNANPKLDSWGTAMGIKEAHDARKLVVAFRDPKLVQHPWLAMHTNYIAGSLEDAIRFLLLE